MYTLMNKNTPLIDFEWIKGELSSTINILKVYNNPWFIKDLQTWLERRSVTKHREFMDILLSSLNLNTTKSIIDFSKGLSLTDTLWVNKDDRYIWDNINLFDNEFDKVIEKIAFDGGMYGKHLATTSPEFGTNGAFAKCWCRESDGKIYLYKQGSSGYSNAGKEIFSEKYASQILDRLGYNHVKYDVIQYRGKLVSRCELFTNKSKMHLPMDVFLEDTFRKMEDVIQVTKKYDVSKKLGELVITDALILNEDRHLGNFGMICNSDTFEPEDMSPIYDNGTSLLCYHQVNEKYPKYNQGTMEEYSRTRIPKLYDDFIVGAQVIASKKQIEHIKCLKGFKFERTGIYNLEENRLIELENIVQNQLESLLQRTVKTNEFS